MAANAPSLTTPLKLLIVDGQNNHNWQGTTPVMQRRLTESGRFTVDVATSPAKMMPLSWSVASVCS